MENHFKFEDLKVYQKAVDFVDSVYAVSAEFPDTEKYGLTSQFRRASVSISLNIAEGTGASNKENLKYLGIASRSLKECVVCSTICKRMKYIDPKQDEKFRSDLAEVAKMISGLMNYLRNKK